MVRSAKNLFFQLRDREIVTYLQVHVIIVVKQRAPRSRDVWLSSRGHAAKIVFISSLS